MIADTVTIGISMCVLSSPLVASPKLAVSVAKPTLKQSKPATKAQRSFTRCPSGARHPKEAQATAKSTPRASIYPAPCEPLNNVELIHTSFDIERASPEALEVLHAGVECHWLWEMRNELMPSSSDSISL